MKEKEKLETEDKSIKDNFEKYQETAIEEVVEKKLKPKTTKKLNSKINCKILWLKEGKIAIDFNGFGIVHNINQEIDNSKKEVIVEYKGTFGDKDFKIVNIKQ